MNKFLLIVDFVNKIDEFIDVEEDDRFCVDIEREIIYITDSFSEREDKIWSAFLKKEFNINYDPYVMSILHEIGHIKTYTEDLNTERNLIYFLLQMKYEEDNFEEFNNEYFKIPMEYNATKWAVEFYRNNYEFCTELSTKLGLTD